MNLKSQNPGTNVPMYLSRQKCQRDTTKIVQARQVDVRDPAMKPSNLPAASGRGQSCRGADCRARNRPLASARVAAHHGGRTAAS